MTVHVHPYIYTCIFGSLWLHLSILSFSYYQMNVGIYFLSLADNDKKHIFILGSYVRIAKSFNNIDMVSGSYKSVKQD